MPIALETLDEIMLNAPVDRWITYVSNRIGKKPRLLGYGSFAHVYEHPTDKDRVVKVVSKKDKCWGLYTEYIKKKSQDRVASKYLPRIYKEAKKRKPQGTGVYIMERLKPWGPAILKRAALKDKMALASLIEYYMRRVLPSTENVILKALGLDRRGKYLQDVLDGFEEAELDNLPLMKIMDELEAFCELDLEEENVMFRSDGQLVLMDPVAQLRR